MVPLWADILEKTRHGEFLEVPINYNRGTPQQCQKTVVP